MQERSKSFLSLLATVVTWTAWAKLYKPKNIGFIQAGIYKKDKNKSIDLAL
jgi:hypothetical protein